MTLNFHDDKSSTICLDAGEVKRLREERKLTQLYVSKVVGVTTDTISRWENNRYPTIRRENAIKLAEALEVSLGEIVLKVADELPESEQPVKKRPPFVWALLAFFVLASLSVTLFLLPGSESVPSVVTGERILPGYAGPASTIPVQIRLIHSGHSSGFILREYFPKGWKIVQSHPPASSLDNVSGVARWIIKAGDERDRVVYLLEVDSAAKPGSTANFQGEIVARADGQQAAAITQGESTMAVAPVHWVDTNGDNRIDDVEMLEGSFTIEDMTGVYIDWDNLEKLWAAGHYAWDDSKKSFLPLPAKP